MAARLQRKFGEVFTITETVPASAFSWLKVPTSALTFEALIRHYAKQVQTSAVQWWTDSGQFATITNAVV